MRINFLAGAGAGKSTTAAWLFSELKRQDYSVELVTEYVKSWTYINRLPKGFDQVYLFGKQLHYEDKILSSGVKNIVTDSPIYLSHIYSRMFSGIEGLADNLLDLANLYDKYHPSVAIYLQRGDKEYKKEGRWGDVEGARLVDEEVLAFVSHKYRHSPDKLLITDWNHKEDILAFAKKHLDK